MTGTALLTIPEAAAELRIHRDSVYELIACGALKAVDVAVKRTRTKTRVRRVDLEQFIADRTRSAQRRAS